jgi:2Fe-2S ferredoxin
MAKITYIEYGSGKEHVIDVKKGHTVKDGAVDNSIPGIEAICGGSCSCSTCHVYVDEPWLARLPEQEDMEKEVLEFAYDVRASSRLSCQLQVTDDLDGLVVRMPEQQNV